MVCFFIKDHVIFFTQSRACWTVRRITSSHVARSWLTFRSVCPAHLPVLHLPVVLLFKEGRLFIHVHATENLKERILKRIITWFVINEAKRENGEASDIYYNSTYGNLQVRNITQKLFGLQTFKVNCYSMNLFRR